MKCVTQLVLVAAVFGVVAADSNDELGYVTRKLVSVPVTDSSPTAAASDEQGSSPLATAPAPGSFDADPAVFGMTMGLMPANANAFTGMITGLTADQEMMTGLTADQGEPNEMMTVAPSPGALTGMMMGMKAGSDVVPEMTAGPSLGALTGMMTEPLAVNTPAAEKDEAPVSDPPTSPSTAPPNKGSEKGASGFPGAGVFSNAMSKVSDFFSNMFSGSDSKKETKTATADTAGLATNDLSFSALSGETATAGSSISEDNSASERSGAALASDTTAKPAAKASQALRGVDV